MQGVTVIRLGYAADPEKAHPAWKAAMQVGVPTDVWEREFEGNALAGLGLSIYGREYRPDKHERPLAPIPGHVMGHGWDFGKGCPAKVWVQRTIHNGVRVLASQFGTDILLKPFAEQMIAFEINVLGGPFHARRDYVDPAGSQPKDDGMKSVEVLQAFGWVPKWRGSEYTERHKHVSELLLRDQLDGEPMFLIDPRLNPELCAAFRSRYRRDKQGDPVREHPYTDLMNALEYYLVNTKTAPRAQGPGQDPRWLNPVTGYGRPPMLGRRPMEDAYGPAR